MSSEIISARRENVSTSYISARAENNLKYLEGDVKATSEYIYENQVIDAINIVNEFYKNNRRAISITKKTKVGMDGLMIEIAMRMTTHIDDNFVVNPSNVRIITGMSNMEWEREMKIKTPSCFKDNIFHHGQLKKGKLKNISNALIIIDEIDTGDKEKQVLHETLKESGILDIDYMIKNNIRFIFASATMIKELYDLYKWGDLHYLYKMTIPKTYIGHKEFLEKKIILDFFPLDTPENVEKWLNDDIINFYKEDKRIHIVRVNKNVNIIQDTCIIKKIKYLTHNSTDKISNEELNKLFEEELEEHVVIIVKGFYRRANLIPNKWKMRIGAIHELYSRNVDDSVQIQGLVGRMTGYWKHIIDSGHKTGPYRCSIKSIEKYEESFIDPFGNNSYKTSGFNKKKGKLSSSNKSTMLSYKNIKGLEQLEEEYKTNNEYTRGFKIFDTQKENDEYSKSFGSKRKASYDIDENGFKLCSTTYKGIHSLKEIIDIATVSKLGSNLDKPIDSLKVGEFAYRRYVCYENINDNKSCKYITVWIKKN